MKNRVILASILFLPLISACSSGGTDEQSLQVRKEYYADGKIKRMYFTDKKRMIQGKLTFFDSLGNVQFTTEVKNNKRDGKTIEYYLNGKILRETTFANGIKEGIEIEYYTNGKRSYTMNNKNGKSNGFQVRYDTTGKPVLQVYYQDGVELYQSQYDEKGNKIEETITPYISQNKKEVKLGDSIEFKVKFQLPFKGRFDVLVAHNGTPSIKGIKRFDRIATDTYRGAYYPTKKGVDSLVLFIEYFPASIDTLTNSKNYRFVYFTVK
jgi:hypothetical protein